MKNLVPLLVLSLAACVPSSQGGGFDWPKVATCAPDANDAVAVVSRVLLGDGDASQFEISDRAVDELADVARQYGADTVVCLVDLLVDEWLRPGASANPDRAAAAMRGRDFLEAIGTSIQRTEPQATAPRAAPTKGNRYAARQERERAARWGRGDDPGEGHRCPTWRGVLQRHRGDGRAHVPRRAPDGRHAEHQAGRESVLRLRA